MDRWVHRFRHRLLAWFHRSRSVPILYVRRFPYKEIKRATGGFNTIVYSNARNAAYKAKFLDGRVTLVKELSLNDDTFTTEVQLLGRLHHRHLLALRGFSTGHKRLLVFDEIGNGSLRDHLNDPLRTPLNWRMRLQIAAGVAAALEYLLLFTDPPMCHVSISSSTIMLDENFTAKISDVGFLCSPVTIGSYQEASKSDDYMDQKCAKMIYQLGVLILELITGQSSDGTGGDLIKWIQGTNFARTINKMIDPDLGNSFDQKEVRNLLAIAKLCIKSKDKPRFSIPQIFRYLQSKVEDSFGGYMVAFAGRKYAARSQPAFVANSTFIVTSFTLVLEFEKGRLQNLFWKRDGCSSCSGKSRSSYVCLNNQDCAIRTSSCRNRGGTVDCSLGIQLTFSGTDKHLTALNSWYEVKNLRQYSLYSVYSNLMDSLTSQYNRFF